MNRYGGNTSCVQLTLASGEELILDAGTGIRNLGVDLTPGKRINILLTHLHLDHIQGLMFFPPCFRPESEITIWGPSSPEASLEDRIARYISAPLSPVEVRELPCSVSFRDNAGDRVGARRCDDPRRGDHPSRPDARLPGHRRRNDDRLHPGPRAGAPRAAGGARARVDLGLRPRPRRRSADPRLPVHRPGVPRPCRLGPFGAGGHAHLRAPGRGAAARDFPPRSAALRRVSRRLRRRGARRLARPRRRPDPDRARSRGAARSRSAPRLSPPVHA